MSIRNPEKFRKSVKGSPVEQTKRTYHANNANQSSHADNVNSHIPLAFCTIFKHFTQDILHLINKKLLHITFKK